MRGVGFEPTRVAPPGNRVKVQPYFGELIEGFEQGRGKTYTWRHTVLY
jgi:hypothetical protein